MNTRRPILSVIGSGAPLEGQVEETVRSLGRQAVEAGFRVCTGGLGGVMAAAAAGARTADGYREGDTLGFLPSGERETANPDIDIAVPTGLGLARNLLVVSAADVVVAVSGGSGTLSEIALAWQLGRPIISLSGHGGWADRLAQTTLDDRRSDQILHAESVEDVIALALDTYAMSRGGADK